MINTRYHILFNKITRTQHYELYEYNTTQHNTTQHNTTQHNTTQHNTTHHITTQHNTTQHNTTQHNTTQHRTRQGRTVQCSIASALLPEHELLLEPFKLPQNPLGQGQLIPALQYVPALHCTSDIRILTSLPGKYYRRDVDIKL